MQSSWAAVLRKGIRTSSNTHHSYERETSNSKEVLAESNATLQTPSDPKSARRHQLLQQALKSPCNAVTNERYCLSCGRPFMDLFRLAQHIADKHNSINAPHDDHCPALHNDDIPNVRADQRAPGNARSEKKLTLGDVLLPAPASRLPQNTKHDDGHSAEKIGVLTMLTTDALNPFHSSKPIAGYHAPKDASTSNVPLATTPQIPQSQKLDGAKHTQHGVGRLRRKKQQSRLKKGYTRAKAQQNILYWQDILASIEEAMQLTRELIVEYGDVDAIRQEKSSMAAVQLQDSPPGGGDYDDDTAVICTSAASLAALLNRHALAHERLNHLLSAHTTARNYLSQAQHTFDPVSFPVIVHQESQKLEDSQTLEDKQQQEQQEREDNHHIDNDDDDEKNQADVRDGIIASALDDCTLDETGRRKEEDIEEIVCQASSLHDEYIEENSSDPCRGDSSTGTEISSSSSSDGSFGLQWGNTLLTWVQHVGADAKQEKKEIQHTLNQHTRTKNSIQDKNYQKEKSGNVTGQPYKSSSSNSNSRAKEKSHVDTRGTVTKQQQQKLHTKKPHKQLQSNDIRSLASLHASAVLYSQEDAIPSANRSHDAHLLSWLDSSPSPLHDAVQDNPYTAQQRTAVGVDSIEVPCNDTTTHDAFGVIKSATNTTQESTVRALVDYSTMLQHHDAIAVHATESSEYYCPLCNKTANGPSCWQDHINSQRHKKKVQQQHLGIGVEWPQAVDLLVPTISISSSQITRHAPAKHQAGPRSQQPRTLNPKPRRYTGIDADVASYVDHVITPELNAAVDAFLRQLIQWQERVRSNDPINFRRKRRVVSGIREVQKFVNIEKKVKLLIVAPNVEDMLVTSTDQHGTIHDDQHMEMAYDDAVPESGGVPAGWKLGNATATQTPDEFPTEPPTLHPLHDAGVLKRENPVTALLDDAKAMNVPVIFALSRLKLGKLLGKRKSASAFAVLNMDGAEELYGTLMQCYKDAVAGGGGNICTN